MDKPRDEIRAYLAGVAPGAKISALAGDASTRSFFRVVLPEGGSRILMDYGQPFAGRTDDVELTAIFTSAGLRVPRIYDVSADSGSLLLEDLGDLTLESVLLNPGTDRAETAELLRRAVILASEIADKGSPVLAASPRAAGPALDIQRFRFEMDFFIEHYAGSLLRRDNLPEKLQALLHELATEAADTPRSVMCHRDFHSRNLIVLPGGELAMVDIQDARWGPDSYDLASLLFDAYVDTGREALEPSIESFLQASPETIEAGFRDRLKRVATQRMIKALGTFGYQIAIRGRSLYLDAVPRTLSRLRALLRESDSDLLDGLESERLLETPDL